jgi:hypothetical protein
VALDGFFYKREHLRRLELRAIVTRLNSILQRKFGDCFIFFEMAVLSQVNECTSWLFLPIQRITFPGTANLWFKPAEASSDMVRHNFARVEKPYPKLNASINRKPNFYFPISNFIFNIP